MDNLCTICGGNLSPHDKFCSNCGAKTLSSANSLGGQVSDNWPCPSCGESIPRGTESCPHCDSIVTQKCHACKQNMDHDLEICPHCSASIYKSCPLCNGKIMHNSNYCKHCKNWLTVKPNTEEELKTLRGCMSFILTIELVFLAWSIGDTQGWENWTAVIVGIFISILYSMSSLLRVIINLACSFIWGFTLMNLSPVMFDNESWDRFDFRMLHENWSWEYWYIGVIIFFISMALHQFAKEKF